MDRAGGRGSARGLVGSRTAGRCARVTREGSARRARSRGWRRCAACRPVRSGRWPTPPLRPAAPRPRRRRVPVPGVRAEQPHWEAGAVVAGVDEVGCGAWAGPVTVGAVVLPSDRRMYKLRDSKVLTPAAREHLAVRIRGFAVGVAIGHASNDEIDELGLSDARRLAARRAVDALPTRPDVLLLDGNWDFLAGYGTHNELLIRGDGRSTSIAAASIVAKVDPRRDARPSGTPDHPGYALRVEQGLPVALTPSRAPRARALRPAPALVGPDRRAATGTAVRHGPRAHAGYATAARTGQPAACDRGPSELTDSPISSASGTSSASGAGDLRVGDVHVLDAGQHAGVIDGEQDDHGPSDDVVAFDEPERAARIGRVRPVVAEEEQPALGDDDRAVVGVLLDPVRLVEGDPVDEHLRRRRCGPRRPADR